MSEIGHYMSAVNRLRAAISAAKDELAAIADEADEKIGERIDSVRAGLDDAMSSRLPGEGDQ